MPIDDDKNIEHLKVFRCNSQGMIVKYLLRFACGSCRRAKAEPSARLERLYQSANDVLFTIC